MHYRIFSQIPQRCLKPGLKGPLHALSQHQKMARAHARLESALNHYIPVTQAQITKLEGDVSTRLYFRVGAPELASHIGAPTLVAMVLPSPVGDAPLDFIDVGYYLRRSGLPVPQLYHYNRQQGVLFLEDLQDCLLENCVQPADQAKKRTWYRAAIDLLVEIQNRNNGAEGLTCVAYHRAFDMKKFLWEMRRFRVYLMGFHGGKRISPEDWFELSQECYRVAQVLCSQPQVLTHRDYHCRNIMVHRGQLCLIDFQDARLGPAQYDLASLLRDSYAELSPELMEEMVDYYLTHPENVFSTLYPPHPYLKSRQAREGFNRVYDFATVERNMHAAACFAWLHRDCGVSRYLQYIPRTLGYMRQALIRQSELSRLRALLARYVEELS